MLKIWDANNFRRTLAGLCLITASLALGAADLIRISVEGDAQGTRDQFDHIAASPGVWQVATVLNMLGIVLFVPAVLGLLHLLHHRGAVLGHIGGGLLLIGLLGFAAHNAGYYGTLGAVSAPGIDQEQMIRFWQAAETVPGNLVSLLMFLIGYVLGMVLLGVGLFWARVVPRWTAALIVLYVVGFLFAEESLLLALISWMLLFVGLGTIGFMLLRQSDADWAKHAGLGEEGSVTQPASPAVRQQG
jgi:hypothetical protein